jgi:hypothetical protein
VKNLLMWPGARHLTLIAPGVAVNYGRPSLRESWDIVMQKTENTFPIHAY